MNVRWGKPDDQHGGIIYIRPAKPRDTKQMILVAESGSTKCDWLLLNEEGKHVETYHSTGFNPYYHSRESILSELRAQDDLRRAKNTVQALYFFGAGCSSEEKRSYIRAVLKVFFEGSEIYVDHDLSAAAYSTWTGTPAISCILGTGSNACYFDGKQIEQEVPSLAFILGDEGSGAYFGKRLLRQYFYRKLPAHLSAEMEERYALTRDLVLERVYRTSFPNVYLAGFMPFIVEHRSDLLIRQWILEGFDEFLDLHVMCYDAYGEVPVHFVGSIADLLEEELRQAAGNKGLNIGEIIRKPGRRLAEYVWNHRDSMGGKEKR